jgi:hypothetical protein
MYALLLYAVAIIVPIAAILTGIVSVRFYLKDLRERTE